MKYETLGDRMKGAYENKYRLYLPERIPVIIRLDGKAFHTFCRGLKKPFDDSMDDFTLRSEELSVLEDEAGEKLNHAFDFIEEVFKDGQEMLIFVTELTITPEISSFLAENECEKYDVYNEKLMVGSGRAKLLKELER